MNKNDLDRHITGDYGEDQFRDLDQQSQEQYWLNEELKAIWQKLGEMDNALAGRDPACLNLALAVDTLRADIERDERRDREWEEDMESRDKLTAENRELVKRLALAEQDVAVYKAALMTAMRAMKEWRSNDEHS